MNGAHLEGGLTKDKVGILAIMTGLHDPKIKQKIVENFKDDMYTIDDLTTWSDRQEIAAAPLSTGKGNVNTLKGETKGRCKTCNRRKKCVGKCPDPCTLCGLKRHIVDDCWGNPKAKYYKETFVVKKSVNIIVNKKQNLLINDTTENTNLSENIHNVDREHIVEKVTPLNPEAGIFIPTSPLLSSVIT